ncbi:8037_t:CDS:2 [Entrophospora sp. SA101]|nr:5415_t:CDS:2 [Entrophospora sp. SA101]CAJ0838120.1 8037_t:CDS:2 [Entrophospora sp. SA101]
MSNSSSLKVLSTSAVDQYRGACLIDDECNHVAGIKKDFVLVSDFDIEKSVHNNLGKVGAVLVAFMDEVESR